MRPMENISQKSIIVKRTYPEFNKEYFTVRVSSHTSTCIMHGYTPAEVAIVMHVMHKEPKGTP